MPSPISLKTQTDDWIFLVPVTGVNLTRAVKDEIRLDRATLITLDRLSRVRRRFHFPVRISHLRKDPHFRSLLEKSEVFAIMRHRGRPEDIKTSLLYRLRRELSILASSQLGYRSRRSVSEITPIGESPTRVSDTVFLSTQSISYLLQESVLRPYFDLSLDDGWLNYQKMSFFWDFLRILQGEIPLNNKWRGRLATVAVLIGQSQTAFNLDQALLWNIIALETIFVGRDVPKFETLDRRLATLLDWTDHWTQHDFSSKLKSAYEKRSTFVHDGYSNDPATEDDVAFTDLLLLNSLLNIVRHPKLFYSKGKIIEFSERMRAASVLGLQDKYRPKTLEAIFPSILI